MRFFNAILDLIFPTRCLSCKRLGSEFCTDCLSVAPNAERESAQWIFPAYDYRHDPIQQAVWLLKYKGKKNLARIFAEAIYGQILEELAGLIQMEDFRNPILIPIPLSRSRHKERGFNQAELICRSLLEIDEGHNFSLKTDVLIKTKETEHQARIENRKERLKNIVGSFRLKNSELIGGKNIILVDDVTTTGATLSEAKKVLEQAGARKVIAFTFAH